jgi:hypothetical protein
MKSSAAKKIPSFAERWECMLDELEDLSNAECAEAIKALKDRVDERLDRMAENCRPTSIPGPWLRTNWMGKGGGNVFEALLAAVKEYPDREI